MSIIKLKNNALSNLTSFTGSASLGDMVLISSATASASATIDFSLGNYKEYKFFFVNMHPQTDNVDFTFQVSTNNGSSYGVAITSTFFISYQEEDGDPYGLSYNDSFDLANSTSEQFLQYDIGNDNDQNLSGYLHLFNPASTTYVKHYLYTGNGNGWLDVSQNCFTGGYINSTSVLTNIRFKFSSGNIDDGKILLFGLN